MTTNDFLPFATGGGANVQSQSDYAADGARTGGVSTGTAASNKANKAWRQACFIASVVAQVICNRTGQDMLDDGDAAGAATKLTNALGPPSSRSITGTGMATGGGDLTADRTINVPIASQAEAVAGTDNTKGMTPLRVAQAIAQAILGAGSVPTSRLVSTSGLATGGGDLSADRTINVPKASASDVATGTDDTKAVTSLALAGSTFESSPMAITLGGLHQAAHGLGAMPKDFDAYLLCLNGELGYTTGDVLKLASAQDSTSGWTVYANGTYVGARCGSTAMFLLNASGSNATLNPARWNIFFRAKGRY